MSFSRIVIAAYALAGIAHLVACDANWLPKCDTPDHKCPPVASGEDPTPYPPGTPFRKNNDAGVKDAGRE